MLVTKTFKTMTNKRQLKKSINYICDSLIGECLAIALYGANEKKENLIDETISSILNMQEDFLSRISHPEPGMSQKKYFASLKQDFAKSVAEVIDNIRNIA